MLTKSMFERLSAALDGKITAEERGILEQAGYFSDGKVTDKGLAALEPYRVKRAIVLAAGFGSRLVPVTLDTPKPLVKVHGKRIVETVLDALVARGITDITLVRGYKKEQFDVLLEKYPFLRLIDNDEYDKTNNISSAIRAIEEIEDCYICEADLLLANPAILRGYEYETNYLASACEETDDWCFDEENGRAVRYRKGGRNCFQAYGISYWNKTDARRLREDLQSVFATAEGKNIFWEFVPLVERTEKYNVAIRRCQKSDIVEIDNFSELTAIDGSYVGYQSKN